MNILEVTASGRHSGSVSRMLAGEVVDSLEAREGDVAITRRDLAAGVSLVDEAWIGANFTPEDERTDGQVAALSESDELVAELRAADVIVIGSPMYNFSIPAALKAWIDLITRARLTFRYTADGPEGLLKGKKAYVVIATGGAAVGGPADFATPYLRFALEFVGITDIDFIAADQLGSRSEESIDAARVQIADLIHTTRPSDDRAA